jgi:hypothetical protein
MRNWPVKMRHLLTDTAPVNEDLESLLQRLADKTSTANTASTLIDALTAPSEQAFYAAKQFDDKTKSCKKCHDIAKLEKADGSASSSSNSSGGWGSISSQPNAKTTWTASRRSWPLSASQLPKAKTP